MGKNYRGTILYSTGTGKTEISFECARRLIETHEKKDELVMAGTLLKSSESIHLTSQNDLFGLVNQGEKINGWKRKRKSTPSIFDKRL